MTSTITIEAVVNASVEKVWELYTDPEHVKQWNNASDDWHTPSAKNDLRAGGRFVYRMEARDGSAGFDFGGTYDEVNENKLIEYTMDDDRTVRVTFTEHDGKTEVKVVFEPEGTNPENIQRDGWQSILDNFKKYAEGKL